MFSWSENYIPGFLVERTEETNFQEKEYMG